jgi:hypothetical protein
VSMHIGTLNGTCPCQRCQAGRAGSASMVITPWTLGSSGSGKSPRARWLARTQRANRGPRKHVRRINHHPHRKA